MLNPDGLSDILLFSTVKITVQKPDKMSYGTGFFFEVSISPNRNILVLITNKHVIENGVAGDFDIYLANSDGTPNGKFETFLIRNFEKYWINHPTAEVDLCAYIVNLDHIFEPSNGLTKWRIQTLKETMILDHNELKSLKTVEEVLMVGYPDGLVDLDSHYPLIRKGITSLHPAITYNKSTNKSLGVLDISAFPGSSGSPIFIFNEGIYQKPGEKIELSRRLILLGILSEELTNSFNPSDSNKYHLNLGPYVKASELLILGKEVKKVHILQTNPTVTETIEKELEVINNHPGQSFNSAILQVYDKVVQEIRDFIVWNDNEAPKDSLPPLQTVINEINYLVDENKITNIIIDDFVELLNYRNLAIDNAEQTNNNEIWQQAFEAAKRIIVSFRLLRQN